VARQQWLLNEEGSMRLQELNKLLGKTLVDSTVEVTSMSVE
jgi:hypothetical protein